MRLLNSSVSKTKLLHDAWGKSFAQRPHPDLRRARWRGKTLVAKWTAELAAQNWPAATPLLPKGTRVATGRSSDLFLKEALNSSQTTGTAKGLKGVRCRSRRRSRRPALGPASSVTAQSPHPRRLEPQNTRPMRPRSSQVNLKIKALPNSERRPQPGMHSLLFAAGYARVLADRGNLLRPATLAWICSKSSCARPELNAGGKRQSNALTLNLLGNPSLRRARRRYSQTRPRETRRSDAEEQGGHAFRAYVKSFENEGKNGNAHRTLQLPDCSTGR